MYVRMCLKVEVKQWCVLLPTSYIKTAATESVDPFSAMRDVFAARLLPDTMIVCTPELCLYSSGRMHADTVTDIPVRTVEHSIASKEYLCLKLGNLTCCGFIFYIFYYYHYYYY